MVETQVKALFFLTECKRSPSGCGINAHVIFRSVKMLSELDFHVVME